MFISYFSQLPVAHPPHFYPVAHSLPRVNKKPPPRAWVPYPFFARHVIQELVQQQPKFGARYLATKHGEVLMHTNSAYGRMRVVGFSRKTVEDLLQMNFGQPGGRWREGRPAPARYEGPLSIEVSLFQNETDRQGRPVWIPAYSYQGAIPPEVKERARKAEKAGPPVTEEGKHAKQKPPTVVRP